MEYIHGYRLDRYAHRLARRHRINITKVIKLFLNIAMAVRAVHLSDFVICDLCQYNFMVTRSGRIMIVDCDSFQIINYPNEGVHQEASDYIAEFDGRYLSCDVDFNLLQYMFEEIIKYFTSEIQKQYADIICTYRSKINDVSGLIYAFYYFLHSKGKI